MTSALVSFDPPANNGGSNITLYSVRSFPDSGQAYGPSSPILVTGLTPGITYTFTVAATNAVGVGSESVPSIPVLVSAIGDGGSSGGGGSSGDGSGPGGSSGDGGGS